MVSALLVVLAAQGADTYVATYDVFSKGKPCGTVRYENKVRADGGYDSAVNGTYILQGFPYKFSTTTSSDKRGRPLKHTLRFAGRTSSSVTTTTYGATYVEVEQIKDGKRQGKNRVPIPKGAALTHNSRWFKPHAPPKGAKSSIDYPAADGKWQKRTIVYLGLVDFEFKGKKLKVHTTREGSGQTWFRPGAPPYQRRFSLASIPLTEIRREPDSSYKKKADRPRE